MQQVNGNIVTHQISIISMYNIEKEFEKCDRTIVDLNKKVQILAVQRQIAKDSLVTKQTQVQDLLQSLKDHEMASAILLNVAKKTQQNLAYRLSNLVSTCLSSVFDEPYTFEVKYEEKRGKTEIDFNLTRDGMSLDNPILSVGGGVVSVIAFALRMACLCLSTPPLRRVLVLDEPFTAVHGEDQQRKVGELVNRLSEELNLQILLIANLQDSKTLLETLNCTILHVEKGQVT